LTLVIKNLIQFSFVLNIAQKYVMETKKRNCKKNT